MNILICAANGGIGRALLQAVRQRYPQATLYATYRKHRPDTGPADVHWQRADLSDEQSVAQLAQTIAEHSGALDWLINCAGFLHQQQGGHFQGPEKSIRQFDADFFSANIAANTLPTLLLAKHFSPLLKARPNAVFAAVSAKVGSIEDNRLGGWYSYRTSKAALNMALKNLAIEWQRSHKNLCVAALHPGTTDTGLSEPFQKNVPPEKLFSAEQTAGYLLDIVQSLTPEQSGRFWSWNGEQLPW